ncbi:MAG: magnesium and cobalt transport protein CorA [Bacteroidetes bacterium]|jgi:magnesium transporter|nr:magnesium and cobalt transport protein CorA [Bacteroidota bacterium]
MMRVYYQRQTRVQKVQSLSQLETLDGLIWIDLQNPSAAEIADVEANFEFKFQSRQQQLEIESSSRYFETDDEIIANSNFLHFDQQSGLFQSNAVSFILQDDILFTYRDADLSAFSDCVKKIKATGRLFHTGKQILPTLLEMGVDNDADLLEGLAKQVAGLSKELSFSKNPNETIILEINRMQELTMELRQNAVDKQRVLSAILKSREFEGEDYERLRIVIKDINSLIDHTNFNFERLEYLQNTFLGLINIEQNKIIKIFTVASVIFMPPTLIASIYGMNFEFIDAFKWKYGFAFSVGLMALSSLGTLYFFRRRKWL